MVLVPDPLNGRGGTLFLDEIGELPLALQPKLLRTIQDGEIRRLGSGDLRTVDVRIVAATHRNLGDPRPIMDIAGAHVRWRL